MIECLHHQQVALLDRIHRLVTDQIHDVQYLLGQEAASDNDRWIRKLQFWREATTEQSILSDPATPHQRHLVLVYHQLQARLADIVRARDAMIDAPSGTLSDNLCCLYAKALEPIPYDQR